MIWILIVIYIIIIGVEVPSLIKTRMYPELAAFSICFFIGLYMSLAFYYEWPLAGLFQAIINAVDMEMK